MPVLFDMIHDHGRVMNECDAIVEQIGYNSWQLNGEKFFAEFSPK